MLTMLERFRAERLFVVPLFIAEGWHVGETIPADLALDGPETRRDGRIVRYTPPVGTHPALASVIRDLARETLQPSTSNLQPPTSNLQPPTSYLLPPTPLRVEPHRVCGPGEPTVELPPDPEAIRRYVRLDEAGRYRPLSGASNLRPGWWVPLRDGLTAADVIEAVYPLATVHFRQYAEGTLRVVPLDEVLERQSGRYESARQLSPHGRQVVRDVLCGQCVRTPVWPLTSNPQPPTSHLQPPTSHLPCPEPCSVFVALAREAAAWEREGTPPGPVDPAVPFAAFEEPGNEIRETVLAALHIPAPSGATP
jgi:sirohydrochlorin cobaltochelatase